VNSQAVLWVHCARLPASWALFVAPGAALSVGKHSTSAPCRLHALKMARVIACEIRMDVYIQFYTLSEESVSSSRRCCASLGCHMACGPEQLPVSNPDPLAGLPQVFSFKVRGAFNFLASLTPEARAGGVICASAGNHAQGVAMAARHLVRAPWQQKLMGYVRALAWPGRANGRACSAPLPRRSH